MNVITDYTVIQADENAVGKGMIAGEYPLEDGCIVVAEVLREDDNRVVVPWFCCQTEQNRWFAELNLPKGGLYRIEVRLAKAPFSPYTERYEWAGLIAGYRHIGVGEVFILAGQSNMAGYGRDAAFDPPMLGVHMFQNEGKWDIACHPLNSVPHPVYSNNDAAAGTSPGLSFGRMMAQRLHCPVGLICASQGGSLLEEWNPCADDGRLYYEMKKKIEAVGNFAGMVWLQGCSEAMDGKEDTYYNDFVQSVNAWREAFGDFPIVTCQINRHANLESGSDKGWGVVREAQRLAGRQVKRVYVVPTYDLYTTDGIHNSSGSNVILGERMASVLLHAEYHEPGSFAPSVKQIVKVSENEIELYFDTQITGIRTMDDLALGMNIEDDEGLMDCTRAVRTPNGIRVTGERNIVGNAVFHAYWKRIPPAFCVRDCFGLPMLSCYGVPVQNSVQTEVL